MMNYFSTRSCMPSVLLVSAIAALPAPAKAAASATWQSTFDIPAGPLENALLAFSDQASVQVAMRARDVEGLSSNGVKGRYPVQEALARLVGTAPVAVQWTGPTTISVRPEKPKQQLIAFNRAPAEPAVGTPLSPAEATPASPPESPNEIIVTAQKRSERLQDVPISISVVSANTNTDFGVGGTLELQRVVPGLVLSQRNFNAIPFIRGVGNDNGNPGDESPIAVYVDGVYRASAAASTFSLPNIDRIEVLKGPQGTLFGRNATGGVINIITKQPSQTASGEFSVDYANFDRLTASAYVTGPITSNLSANLTARNQKRANGWGKNTTTGNDVYIPVDEGRRIASRRGL